MISPRSSPRLVRRNVPVVVPATVPPPLPPRKSSPTQEQAVLPTTSNHGVRNGIHNTGLGDAQSQSVTNLTHNSIELPQIPKSSSMLNIELHRDYNVEHEIIELSSPETIYGVVIQNSDYYDRNILDIKLPNRHLSCPSNRTVPKTIKPVKSSTTPDISHSSDMSGTQYENVDLEIPPRNKRKINPLERETNVSYENLNMDYIKKLVSEGYSRDSVIKALGITRNNIDMACDILHEFGTKLG